MNRNFILLCLHGLVVCFIHDTVGREAIVGGKEAGKHQFPYQVLLKAHHPTLHCGGGVIDDEFILTAAHCVISKGCKTHGTRMSVLVGMSNLHEDAKSIEVEKIYVPKDYDPENAYKIADIAVLKLQKSLKLSNNKNLKKLELPKDDHTYTDETGKIAGFGYNWVKIIRNAKIGGNDDHNLRFVDATILSHCKNNGPKRADPKAQICAQVKSSKNDSKEGVCTNDSGGPLVLNGKTVIGILSSSSPSCTEKENAAIYTRVSHYLKFIDDAMHDRKNSLRKYELFIL